MLISHNKTMEWLQSKSGSEKEFLMAESKKAVHNTRQKFKDRMVKIKDAQKEAVMEKMRQAEQAWLKKN